MRVHVRVKCEHCGGTSAEPVGKLKPVDRDVLCSACTGTGEVEQWLTVEEFTKLAEQEIRAAEPAPAAA